MNTLHNIAAYLLVGMLLVGGKNPQPSIQALLDQLCHGPAAATAEQQLESSGLRDPAVRRLLSDQLPAVLLQTKDTNTIILLAKLAGALKLISTVPVLSNLLSDDRSKPMSMASIYQMEELIDDPVGAALARIGNPSIANVSVLIESPNPYTPYRAVRVLRKIGTSEARAELIRASESERNPKLQAFIRGSIADMPAPAVKQL